MNCGADCFLCTLPHFVGSNNDPATLLLVIETIIIKISFEKITK